MSFSSLGLSATILENVANQGYEIPSPIQQQAIPAVLQRKDIMAAAQTGTGKTAGFTLPLLQILSQGNRPQANQVRALVLTPTRELAAQVSASVTTYSKNLNLSSTVVFGGVKINPQMMKLRGGIDVLVATPGRLLDLYNQRAVKFDQLEVLILDEADRMLDMGFIHDIRRIMKALPKQRQNLLFSATFSDDIRQLAKGILNDPIEISVSPQNTTAINVKQWIAPVDKKQKSALLTHLIWENRWEQVLVFTRTKHGANKLTRHLESEKIKASAIHGNKSQGARTRALADFKAGAVRVLVATDIAARGIDINQLEQVINFDLPTVPEDYVHRIGRTGRAGASGQAISLVSADEFKQLCDIERVIKQLLERKEVDGFEPQHPVPPSRLVTTVAKPKKPKKPRQYANNNEGKQPSRSNNSKPSYAKRAAKPANGQSRNTNGANSDSSRTKKNNTNNAASRPRNPQR